MEKKGKINKYTCENCGKSIITENMDDGVTPMFIRCRINNDGMMQSHWYRIMQNQAPTHEWYKPQKPKTDHERNGGLILRPIME